MIPDCDGLLGVAGVALYPILTLWTFFGMALVADEYFGVALDGLVSKYRIPDAVAGATILAVGTSFPELIIGFVSQFLSAEPEPSISMGVTCGSAIFNQLAIVGACALAAPGGRLRVSWRAMLRDALLWVATIGLAAGLLADGEVTALDGWLMVALYMAYVFLCGFWDKIDGLLTGGAKNDSPRPPPTSDAEAPSTSKEGTAEAPQKGRLSVKPAARVMRMVLPYKPRHHESAIYVPTDRRKRHLGDCHQDAPGPIGVEEAAEEPKGTTPFEAHAAATAAVGASREAAAGEDGGADGPHHFDEDHGPLGGPMPPGVVPKVAYIAQAPFAILCYVLRFPSLRRRKMHEVLALAGGVVLAGIAYLMTQWLELSACVLGVPKITLSLLFSAPGTSLPELMVARGVARHGLGTSAVSTSLGSNIFDILIALGLPWAVFASVYSEPIYVDSTLVLTCVMAASTGYFLVVALASGWVINTKVGYTMLGLYFLFDVYVILEAIPGLPISGLSSSIS